MPSSVIPRTVEITNGIPGQAIELVFDSKTENPINGHKQNVEDALKQYTFDSNGKILITFNSIWCNNEEHHGMYARVRFEYYQHTYYITFNYI